MVDACERAGVRTSVDPVLRQRASEDYAWLSPILSMRLPEEPAAVVAWPLSAEQMAVAVGAAHREGLAVTLRGRGTGNYGQAVPLRGGLVVDCTAMDRVLRIDDGTATVEPGVTCAALERAARLRDQELALLPSTVNSTLGGFVAGGAFGSGSIRHGLVWDGFVDGLDVMDCSDDPAVHPISPDGLAAHLHSYGTTGVLAALRVRLDPLTAWTGLAATFDDPAAAVAAGEKVLGALDLRLLGVSDAALVAALPGRPWLAEGRASLRAIVAAHDVAPLTDAVARFGGRVEAVGDELRTDVMSMSHTHVALRAKRADPHVCHLQVGGRALVERADEVRSVLPEGRLHLDAVRRPDGLGFEGLLISRFAGADALADGVDALREMGVFVADAHSWMVDDPDGLAAAAAARFDPDGLLNPGKLARGRHLTPAG